MGGNLRWQNGTCTAVTVTSGTYRHDPPALAVVGLMARYEFTPQLSLQINVHNVFDKKDWAYVEASGTYSAPRNALATMH